MVEQDYYHVRFFDPQTGHERRALYMAPEDREARGKLSRYEAAELFRSLRRSGVRGIRVVPVSASHRARSHVRRIAGNAVVSEGAVLEFVATGPRDAITGEPAVDTHWHYTPGPPPTRYVYVPGSRSHRRIVP